MLCLVLVAAAATDGSVWVAGPPLATARGAFGLVAAALLQA
jgi:hypothetical protein